MTLMLDNTAKPVELLPMTDAVSKLARSMADGVGNYQVLVADEQRRFRSHYLDLPAPLVLMSASYQPVRERETERVTRRVLFARDRYECQYCDFVASSRSAMRELTVDHVKPARLFATREQATTWDNVVAACRSCNQRKGGKLPMESGMMPRCTPKRPHYVQVRFAGRLNPAQRDYVATYFGWEPDDVVL